MPSFPPIPQFDLTAQQPVTIDSLVAALTARLGVPSNPYWVLPELTAYIGEALRTWNALTKHWHARIPLSITPGTLFYDLSAVPQLAYTVRDVDLIPVIEYHLLEPPTPTSWTGSEMFTLADLTAALQRRRDQFLVETGAVLSQYSLPISASPVGRFALSEAVLDVRRAVFQDTNGKYYQMSAEDEIALASFLPSWDSASKTPKAWSTGVTPPFQLQLAPPPSQPGTLQMIVTATGATLDPTAGVALGVPDDFSWVVKWGALADLLGRDSPARDPARAQYAEQRYQQGIDQARSAATVMNATINNRQVKVESVYDLDYYSPNWHNTIGLANRFAMAGMNILAPNRMPDTGYTATLDAVINAPVTALTGTDLGLSPSVADALVDYAEHLAAFKMAGEEFQATLPHLERLLRLAGVEDERSSAASSYEKTLEDRETREETQRWRRSPVSAAR